MKYELDTLEILVQAILNNGSGTETMQTLYKEEERLIKAVTENIFSLSSQYHIRQYISWHQRGLVKLADQMYRKIGYGKLDLRKVLVIILNLLENMVHAFAEHIDLIVHLPKAMLDRERRGVGIVLEKLRTLLLEQHVSEKLTEIALSPIVDFMINNAHKAITYGDYHFIKHYLLGLKDLDFNESRHDFMDYVLSDKLIMMNYNTMALFEYCTTEINNIAKRCPGLEEKKKALIRIKKLLNQLPVISGVSYDSRFQPIKTALLKWTKEEIFYLDRLSLQEQNGGLVFNLTKLTLPVPQIALFAFLSQKHGVYADLDKNGVIHHYTHSYCSKETVQMSESNFRNHFNSSPTDPAARGLRTLLGKFTDDLDDFLT